MFGRGRGQVAAAEFALFMAHRLGSNRVLEPVLPYQEVPNQERYEADGEHILSDEDHRRAAGMLGIILGARVATEKRPLWSSEVLDTMVELNVPGLARLHVMTYANRIPPEYTNDVLVFQRMDAHHQVFFYEELR